MDDAKKQVRTVRAMNKIERIKRQMSVLHPMLFDNSDL